MFCQRCKKNEVENIKYLCLECICAFPDCYAEKVNKYFCDKHTCRSHCKDNGTGFYLTKNVGHYKNKEDNSFYIENDVCHMDVVVCEMLVHTEKCNSMNNNVSTFYTDCTNLNKCTFLYCKKLFVNSELKRCSEHISKCYSCKISFPMSTSHQYLCEKCLPSHDKMSICYECNTAYKKSFVIGKACLYHHYRWNKNYKLSTQFNQILLIKNTLYANVMYYEYLHVVLPYLNLFSRIFPRDVLNIILNHIKKNPFIPLLTLMKNTQKTKINPQRNNFILFFCIGLSDLSFFKHN